LNFRDPATNEQEKPMWQAKTITGYDHFELCFHYFCNVLSFQGDQICEKKSKIVMATLSLKCALL
jgi:hypothetical protein